jgi:hypothetical protein
MLPPPQCPNPECPPGTIASRTAPMLVGPGERGLKALLYSPWAWLVLSLLSWLAIISGVALFLWLSREAGRSRPGRCLRRVWH